MVEMMVAQMDYMLAVLMAATSAVTSAALMAVPLAQTKVDDLAAHLDSSMAVRKAVPKAANLVAMRAV